jgi:hypothetical protein
VWTKKLCSARTASISPRRRRIGSLNCVTSSVLYTAAGVACAFVTVDECSWRLGQARRARPDGKVLGVQVIPRIAYEG